MYLRFCSPAAALRLAALFVCLALARPTFAQDTSALETFRAQYDVMMSNFESVLAARGDTSGQARAVRGRDAMRALTDDQLAAVFSRSRLPDLSAAVAASHSLAVLAASRKTIVGSNQFSPNSAGLPEPNPITSGCNGVDTDPATRYDLLIAKEVTNSILAAAAWVCNEDILGENGSAACISLVIAADVANGFFDTATFCDGEVTGNEIDANFDRLSHIHDDLAADLATIVNNDNANTTAIKNNDNANAATIVANDNANLVTIINNANANKNELRDLILRTQIEADLAMTDSSAIVELYALPTANGGYLNLVTFIVTDTIAKIQAAGGSISNAPASLTAANAAKAAGDFKGAYKLYRQAYKAAGK